jgi:hypothetical protein
VSGSQGLSDPHRAGKTFSWQRGREGEEVVPVDGFAIPRRGDQARFAAGSEIVEDGGFMLGAIAGRWGDRTMGLCPG